MFEELKVEILMSFYNGDKYIKEQIESILEQDFQGEITIFIRDDGSTNTEISNILEEIEIPLKRKIKLRHGKNLGPQRSFLKLIREADNADYYFYADQDDIWLPHKISRAIKKMNALDSDVKMYCSNFTITDSELKTIEENGVNLRKNTFNFLRAIMFNTFPGCTIGFNYELLKILRNIDIKDCMMHDSYTFATALAFGKVIYDNEPSILHRIHQNNVVGYGFKKIELRKWILEKTKLLINKEPYDLSDYAERLLKINSKPNFYDDICLLRDYKKSIKNTMRLLFHSDLKNKLDRCALSIYCKILFRLF